MRPDDEAPKLGWGEAEKAVTSGAQWSAFRMSDISWRHASLLEVFISRMTSRDFARRFYSPGSDTFYTSRPAIVCRAGCYPFRRRRRRASAPEPLFRRTMMQGRVLLFRWINGGPLLAFLSVVKRCFQTQLQAEILRQHLPGTNCSLRSKESRCVVLHNVN